MLKVDDDTGANDLVMDATNNQILYASTYQRRRTACCMNGGGPGSGIWKSTDGGETWTRLKGNGLPDGPLGRIGLDVYRKRPNIVYALDRRRRRRRRGAADAARRTPDEAPPGRRPRRRSNDGATGGDASTHGRPASIAPTTPARRGAR